MGHVATLIVLFPLLGFLLVLLNGRNMTERQIGATGTGAVTVSFVVSVICFFLYCTTRLVR
jgi:NADH:ubiquinone oxidoreductase subunit 5 (subunit L)/multisubunit Na+/H+ antiporter MnhA subunit